MRISSRQSCLAICLLVVGSLLSGCDGGEVEQTTEPTVRPVKMITLAAASDVETRRFPATVNAGRFSELSFQVGGLIDEVSVAEAQVVAAGDTIARLVTRDFENQVASARSQFGNAEEEYQRAVRLAEQDAIAQSVLEQRRAQRDVARSQLDSAEKALEDAELTAPYSGVIMQVPARATEAVSAGQTVASLMAEGDLEVSISVPAIMIADSQDVESRGAFVFLDAAPQTSIPATFKEIDLIADTASQTYTVTFGFEAPATLVILPGMNATVELSGARRSTAAARNRISVPLSAVTTDGTDNFVWVVDETTMTVSKRVVTVADGIGDAVVVTEGLTAGDVIATAGASFLSDGMQVRPWND